jgi:hypothetical protein
MKFIFLVATKLESQFKNRCMKIRTLLPLVFALFCPFIFNQQCPAQDLQHLWSLLREKLSDSIAGTYYDSRGRIALDLRDDNTGRWYDYNTYGEARRYGIRWMRSNGYRLEIHFNREISREATLYCIANFSQEAGGDLIYDDFTAKCSSEDGFVDAKKSPVLFLIYPFIEERGDRYSKRR